MEAFSLLKYWRGSGGGGGGGVNVTGVGDSGVNTRTAGTTTIVTAVSQTDDESEDNDDDGPFFDLEFTVPDEEEEENQGKENENENESEVEVLEEEEDEDDEEEDDEFDDGGGDEREFKFTLSSGSGSGSSNVDRADPNLSLSPSDDLFFKGRLVPIEPASLVFNPSESEPNSKPQFPVKLLKSATKFRVFMLGLKKSKLPNPTSPKQDKKEPDQQQQQQKQEPKQSTKNKSFTVKFKVEEVPIMSLFTRDSSKSASVNKTQKQNTEELGSSSSSSSTVSEEKKFSKEVMQKYLKKVKPLYVRVSRRYGEKLRFSGQLSLGGAAAGAKPILQKTAAPAAEKSQAAESEGSESSANNNNNNVKTHQKLGNIPTGLRVVCKHLGKSRSASSAVAAAPIGTAAASKRRDDSLLQQQDGIQSAILHCKRSFNASRDSESSLLSRSVSDPLHEKSSELARKSSKEGKDGRI
nr:probable membrane-associated kinase regulator 2 [Quercus suber]